MEDKVKPRYINKESEPEFNSLHRLLQPRFGMFDIDLIDAEASVRMQLKFDKPDTLFFEYRVSDWETGEIKFPALFEVKYKHGKVSDEAMSFKIGTPSYAELQLAKKIGARFFFVIGTNGKRPFHYYEIDRDGVANFVGTFDCTDENAQIKMRQFWNNVLKLH